MDYIQIYANSSFSIYEYIVRALSLHICIYGYTLHFSLFFKKIFYLFVWAHQVLVAACGV